MLKTSYRTDLRWHGATYRNKPTFRGLRLCEMSVGNPCLFFTPAFGTFQELLDIPPSMRGLKALGPNNQGIQ